MTDQTKKALNYIKTFVKNFTIPEDLETIEIWDGILTKYSIVELDSILYWAKKEEDFVYVPLEAIDRVGTEYKKFQAQRKQNEEQNKELTEIANREYTEEQKRDIDLKIQKTKELILRGNKNE